MSIKLQFVSSGGSVGRGIGFYQQNLQSKLVATGEVSLNQTSPDLVHYSFFDLFYPTLPMIKQVPTIVTIHDLTPLVLSKLYPTGLRGAANLLRQRLSLRGVAAVITDSLCSKHDITKFLKIDSKKVFVTPLACDEAYSHQPTPRQLSQVKRKYALPDRFLMYVGGVNVNKNITTLIRASLRANIPLILIGSEFTKPPMATHSFKQKLGLQSIHPEVVEYKRIKHYLSEFPSKLRALGFIPNNELNIIYRLAMAYVQPSLYEGFGLPLLEAMTAGCLTISSNTSSLPEIYHHQSLTFDPTSEDQLLSQIQRAQKFSIRQRFKLINLGLARASDFSWDLTAAKTLSVYQRVLAGKI